MFNLFSGFSGAYGTYEREERNEEKGKVEIKATARTVRKDVTLKLWERHLSGDQPLGIIPISENNTCVWGCVDIDRYDIVHADLVEQILRMKLPLTVCSTKSGGAHVYVFLSEPVDAAEMQAKLRDVAALLGYGDSEIFPKQGRVLTERGDLGNWLNMPYYAGDKSNRYAVKRNGNGATVREFLDVVEKRRITRDQLLAMGKGQDGGTFGDGPPCLQHLSTVGFPEGSRNRGLFALGIFARKKYPEDWAAQLEKFNAEYMNPPLPATEVSDLIANLGKKDYQYNCDEHPLVSHCNSGLCRSRRHGVGSGGTMPPIGGLSVLDSDPPLWFMDVDGQRVELMTDDLQRATQFQKCCMEQIHTVVPVLRRENWEKLLQKLMENVTRIEVPGEVGVSGHFYELLERFCTDRQSASTREEILLGKPWHDEAAGMIYFRLRDLEAFLDRMKFRSYNRAHITTRIRGMGGETEFFNIKGKGVNTWWVPDDFSVQTEPHDLPDLPKEAI